MLNNVIMSVPVLRSSTGRTFPDATYGWRYKSVEEVPSILRVVSHEDQVLPGALNSEEKQ